MQQDQMLGASFPLTMEATPMPRTRQLMHNEGMMALNWFARRFSYPGSASIARMHGSLRAQVERRSVVRSVRGKGALFCLGGRVCVLMPAVAVAVRHMGACVCASACGGGDGEAGVEFWCVAARSSALHVAAISGCIPCRQTATRTVPVPIIRSCEG